MYRAKGTGARGAADRVDRGPYLAAAGERTGGVQGADRQPEGGGHADRRSGCRDCQNVVAYTFTLSCH